MSDTTMQPDTGKQPVVLNEQAKAFLAKIREAIRKHREKQAGQGV